MSPTRHRAGEHEDGSGSAWVDARRARLGLPRLPRPLPRVRHGQPAQAVLRCPLVRKLARRIVAVGPAASLVAWAVVCVLWVRSYGDFDTVRWYDNEWRGTAVRTR